LCFNLVELAIVSITPPLPDLQPATVRLYDSGSMVCRLSRVVFYPPVIWRRYAGYVLECVVVRVEFGFVSILTGV